MTDKDWSEPDWSREKPRQFWDPSRKLIKSIRDYQSVDETSVLSSFKKRWCVLKHRFWSIVTAADIPINSTIGGGLLLIHPTGIVIHPNAKIGVNCLLLQNSTITANVELGYHVDLGAGAIVTNGATIDHTVMIGANAVVTKDFPSNTVVAGVPAKIIGTWEGSEQ